MALTPSGTIAGVHASSPMTFTPASDTLGLYEAADGAVLDVEQIPSLSGADSPGAVEKAAVTINQLSQLTLWTHHYYQNTITKGSPGYFAWSALILPPLPDATLSGDAAVWANRSATATTFYVAVTTSRGLAVTRTDSSGQWEDWQFIADEPGRLPIVRSLTKLRHSPTQMMLAGIGSNTDLVMYGQTGTQDSAGREIWAYDNLTRTVLIPATPNGNTPYFDTTRFGDLVTYTTPWGGLNIAGSSNGTPYAVRWPRASPGGG